VGKLFFMSAVSGLLIASSVGCGAANGKPTTPPLNEQISDDVVDKGQHRPTDDELLHKDQDIPKAPAEEKAAPAPTPRVVEKLPPPPPPH
jgi:hypothetical protein